MRGELSLGQLQSVAEELAEEYLGHYTLTLKSNGRKEINDALWGTVVLSPIEVAILDSPLLQRLRSIRQLGVAHWVYPGAVHTRFEHTIGVLYQIQHLINALNGAASSTRSTDGGQLPIKENYAQLLRICALLHDVGHAAFSHVSEKALEGLPEFSMLSRDFSKSLSGWDRVEDKQLSEILAYYIVRSPAMRKLFDVLLSKHRNALSFSDEHNNNLSLVIDKISHALIGRSIDDSCPLLHELISGPFDADKLDYLVRDARLAGIPSLLDIPRLVQKLAVRAMPAQDLPEEIASQLSLNPTDQAWLFGIKMSAKSVLDELQLARVLAYTKIYRHPKVIAVEQMMRAFIESLIKITAPAQLLKFLYTCADDFIIGMNQNILRNKLDIGRGRSKVIKESLDNVEVSLQALRERRLWVKAFQLNGPSILDERDQESEGMLLFRTHLNHPQEREELVKLVRDETAKLLELDPMRSSPGRAALDALIMARSLSSVSGSTQTGRAYLISNDDRPVQLSAFMESQGSWVEQYMSDQPRAYIFSPSEIADVVFVAIEVVARYKYDLRLHELTAESSKRDKNNLREFKKIIPLAYWKGMPHDVRPLPARLLRADVKSKINEFDKLRSSFQEPPQPSWLSDAEASSIPDNKRTKAWLRQFETDQNVDCALFLLENFRLLSRKDTEAALGAFFRDNPEFQGAWIVPFGGAKDSGVVQAYLTAGGKHIENQGSLQEYEKSGSDRPLVFLDDFIGSGGQATDILAAWFGRDDLRKDLGEEREPLESKILDCLRKRPAAFVFISGWDDGLKAIEKTSKAIGVEFLVYCHIREKDIPFAKPCLNKKFGNNPEVIESFLQRCREIGADLLLSEPGNRLTEERLKERALGYGGRAMLLASFVNVPTQTLTAIWASGRADGVPWSPLLRRRKKS